MFIATGDRDAGDTYSYGIMKSQDGGLNWIQQAYYPIFRVTEETEF